MVFVSICKFVSKVSSHFYFRPAQLYLQKKGSHGTATSGTEALKDDSLILELLGDKSTTQCWQSASLANCERGNQCFSFFSPCLILRAFFLIGMIGVLLWIFFRLFCIKPQWICARFCKIFAFVKSPPSEWAPMNKFSTAAYKFAIGFVYGCSALVNALWAGKLWPSGVVGLHAECSHPLISGLP